MHNDAIPIITIDGPSGSGKGSIGQLLAQQLGWHFLNSGALYRALALMAMEENIELSNTNSLKKLATKLQFDITLQNTGPARIFLFANDVTAKIYAEQCGIIASQIASNAAIREILLTKQREFKKPPGLVADGRDMGTVVFPEAKLKFFLTANREERGKRRYQQLQEQGMNVSLRSVMRDLHQRDIRDKTRTAAPLKIAADALLIDTTNMSIEQTFVYIAKYVMQTFEGVTIDIDSS